MQLKGRKLISEIQEISIDKKLCSDVMNTPEPTQLNIFTMPSTGDSYKFSQQQNNRKFLKIYLIR